MITISCDLNGFQISYKMLRMTHQVFFCIKTRHPLIMSSLWENLSQNPAIITQFSILKILQQFLCQIHAFKTVTYSI